MTESGQSADTLRPSTTRIVDSVDDIGTDWLTDALHQAGHLDEGRVASYITETMSVGQLGTVARLTLAYEDAGPEVLPSVIVKLPSKDAGSRAIGVGLGVYESEVRFYQEIAPTIDIRVPRLYWADIESSTGRFTLLLEDLSGSGAPGDMIAAAHPNKLPERWTRSLNCRCRAGPTRLCSTRIGWRTRAATRICSPRSNRLCRYSWSASVIDLTPKIWSSWSRSCRTPINGQRT
jgi:hypothetical protein